MRQREYPADYLDAFTAFSRGREDNDLVVELRLRSSHQIVENVTLKARQRSIVFLLVLGLGSSARIEIDDFFARTQIGGVPTSLHH